MRLKENMARLTCLFGAVLLLSSAPLQAAGKTAPTRSGQKASTQTKPAGKKASNRKTVSTQARKTGNSRKTKRPPVQSDLPTIRSSSAIAIDLSNGKVLLSKNADRRRSVASLSKLMAALVLLDGGLDLDGVQTISPEDKRLVRRGAPSRLKTGAVYRKRDLLHAALMVSDNVATVALGRSMGWSTQTFARKMTARARKQGLRRTSFQDPTGLSAGNVSTAREMLAILRAAMDHPVIREISRKEEYSFLAFDGAPGEIHYRHTDHYARRFPWKVEGAKTGFTRAAGYCLAIGAQVRDQSIGMIFLGARGGLARFDDYARTMLWLEKRTPAQTSG